MKYPAFAVIYHYPSQRDFIGQEGFFSRNLKVVYIKDDPSYLDQIRGLNLVGYWAGADADQEFLSVIGSYVRG